MSFRVDESPELLCLYAILFCVTLRLLANFELCIVQGLLTEKDKLSIAMQLERIEEGVRKWRNAARSLSRQEQQTVGLNGQEVAVRHE